MNKKLYIWIGILVGLIIILIVLGKAGVIGNKKALKVATEKAQYRRIVEIVTANGKIQPETEVKISADVSGEIVELNVKEGDSITKGTLLLRIKPDIYISTVKRANAAVNSAKSNYASSQARLEQSKAQLKQIEAAYKRSEKLWKNKTISDADFEKAKAQYQSALADVNAAEQAVKAANYQVKSAEASLDEAGENLHKTNIYSPINGIVSQLNVELGERVVGTMQMAGTEIMRLADLNQMEVKVDVNENDIVNVVSGDTAVIEVDAYLGEKFNGIVTEVANSANIQGVSSEQVTNFEVKIRILPDAFIQARAKFPQNKFPFRPGMTATADIQTKVKNHILTVPIQAITTRTDSTGKVAGLAALGTIDESNKNNENSKAKKNVEPKECVFIYDNGKAKLAWVKTGIQDNQYIEIIEGLKDSTEVITAPYNVITRKLKNKLIVEKVSKKSLYK